MLSRFIVDIRLGEYPVGLLSEHVGGGRMLLIPVTHIYRQFDLLHGFGNPTGYSPRRMVNDETGQHSISADDQFLYAYDFARLYGEGRRGKERRKREDRKLQ